MQFLRFLSLTLISFALSACLTEKDANQSDASRIEDKAGTQTIKEIKQDDLDLTNNSDYVPEDGDQAIDFISMLIYGNNKLLVEDYYFNIKNHSHVAELPNQFGYQHTEAGPYVKTEVFKQYSEVSAEKTSVRYATRESPYTLLISHDVKGHIYSTAEFNQNSSTYSNENDDSMSQEETFIYTKKETLFDEYTGNDIGIRNSISNVTPLVAEVLTIRAGIFNTVKARFKSEDSNAIHADISKSWTQTSQGFMWFDINTGSVLKTVSEGTFIRDDYPNSVLITYYNSEFVASDEYPKEAMTLSASNNNADKSMKNIAIQGVIKNNRIMSNNFSAKLTQAPINYRYRL